MLKNLISIAFLFSLLLSQKIIHNPIQNIQTGESIEIEASIIGLANTNQNYSVTLFYRSYGQQTYFKAEMIMFGGQYKYTIPNTFVNNKDLEYFIVLALSDGGFFAYPEDNPHNNPILVKSQHKSNLNIGKTISVVMQPEYQNLSPDENSNIEIDDLLISLSYFKMDDVDENLTKILINEDDYTKEATMRSSHFILIPRDNLPDGLNTVTVLFYTKSGLQYNPITWSFNIFSGKTTSRGIVSKGGDMSGNYSSSVNDGVSSEIGELSGDYSIDFDWLKLKTDLLYSSLEDIQEQPKNRYSLNFNTSFFKIKLGDTYPAFSDYTIKGNRLRGGDILFSNNFLHLHFLSGDLIRAVQGVADDGAMLLEGNSVATFSATGINDIGMVDVTRDNYTFSQQAIGLNMEISPSKRFKWSIELLKVKDRVGSVDLAVENSIITLNEDLVKHLYSDKFVDIDSDDMYSEGEFFGSGPNCMFDHDVVGGIGTFQNVLDLSSISDLFVSYTDTVVIVGSISLSDVGDPLQCVESSFLEEGESYNVKQTQVLIRATINNLDLIINKFKELEQMYAQEELLIPDYCSENSCFGDYEINYLESQWDGSKPQDNIVIATDFSHNLDDGSFKIDYGLGFTMLNQNIWSDPLTYENLDKLGETEESFTDCSGIEDPDNPGYDYGGEVVICDGDQDWEESMGNGVYDIGEPFIDSDSDGVWDDDEDGLFNGAPIPEAINNVEDFEDVFQTGISQVPIIPIDITDGITFTDFLTMPSVSMYINVFQNYFGHRINYGFKQVGPEYNTLGNPYIQTNIREQYFTDKTYFLDNKLNLTFKWKRTEDGISLDQDNGQTDKYDFNLGFYPGANLPTYNLAVGIYDRTNGVDPLYDPIKFISPENDLNNSGTADTLLCSDGETYNFSCDDFSEDSLVVMGFDASNNEILGLIEIYEILSTQLYQPEQTRTGQFSLSINSTVNYIYKHSVNLNIFYSDKSDLVDISKYLVLNPDYYSPRTMTQSYNLGVRTVYSSRLVSTVSLGFSYYDYGLATTSHPEYFQKQGIFSSDVNLLYETPRKITGKIDPGINFSIGRGSVNFTQLGFKMGSKIEIIENLKFYINMNYRFKSVRQTDESGNNSYDFYNNYSFGMDMRYSF